MNATTESRLCDEYFYSDGTINMTAQTAMFTGHSGFVSCLASDLLKNNYQLSERLEDTVAEGVVVLLEEISRFVQERPDVRCSTFIREPVSGAMASHLRLHNPIRGTEYRARLEKNSRKHEDCLYQELERPPTDDEFMEAYGKAEADARTDRFQYVPLECTENEREMQVHPDLIPQKEKNSINVLGWTCNAAPQQRERGKRAYYYWTGYKRIDGRLEHVYIGKIKNPTIEKLEARLKAALQKKGLLLSCSSFKS